MPSFPELILQNLALAAGMMIAMWLLSLMRGDASIVDPFWGFGFVVLAWATWWQTQPSSPHAILLLVMVTVWGIRLSAYLMWRNWGEGEDQRYAAMRGKHGANFWWVSLFTVFLLQGILMWIISLAVQAGVFYADGGLSIWSFCGLALWGVGVFFETVGDFQMARFKSRPDSKGRVMDQGLWKYTRHPNYFGDFCVWWGHYLMAIGSGAWWTIFSPILMSTLLLKVSGVSLLEKDIEERRPEYRDYKKRTNAFFPGPPSSDS